MGRSAGEEVCGGVRRHAEAWGGVQSRAEAYGGVRRCELVWGVSCGWLNGDVWRRETWAGSSVHLSWWQPRGAAGRVGGGSWREPVYPQGLDMQAGG